MKTMHLVAVLLGLATLALFAADASAFYNPSTGTWLQRDPAPGGMMVAPRLGVGGPVVGGGFLPRDPSGQYADGMNLYQYVRSKPVGSVDPSGLREDLGNGIQVLPNGKTIYDPSFDKRSPWEKELDAMRQKIMEPGVFKICRRNVKDDTACANAINTCGGQHTYVGYGDQTHDGWGVGFTGGDKLNPSKEEAFKPTQCKCCSKSDNCIEYNGVKKKAKDATDDEIKACLASHTASKPYGAFSYNCADWANEAAKACGLDCK